MNSYFEEGIVANSLQQTFLPTRERRKTMTLTLHQKYMNRKGYCADKTLNGLVLPPPPPEPKPKVYTFSEPDSDSNILFGEVGANKYPVIKAGTLEKLVERLTYEKYPDTAYTQAFMLTYRSFMSPLELISMLRARYNIRPPVDGSISEAEFLSQKLKPIRLKSEAFLSLFSSLSILLLLLLILLLDTF